MLFSTNNIYGRFHRNFIIISTRIKLLVSRINVSLHVLYCIDFYIRGEIPLTSRNFITISTSIKGFYLFGSKIYLLYDGLTNDHMLILNDRDFDSIIQLISHDYPFVNSNFYSVSGKWKIFVNSS